ncbi:CocE/NonD family hydrolase C-terminal non-catalytic domain-containing protein [Komagataeibacter rhaeticus]|nr:CocE/NonD family hydrolase C-terminal non-catalytic domain-containing protein [Komagataeibacter rhaeticus]
MLPAGQVPPAAVAQSLTLDPWRPAPPQGGSFGMPVGPVDRSRTDARSDIATFTTPPLAASHLLAGEVRCRFVVRSTHPSFDLHAVLSRVATTGQVHTLAEGYAAARPGRPPCPCARPARACNRGGPAAECRALLFPGLSAQSRHRCQPL